jgi:hypothetical protein
VVCSDKETIDLVNRRWSEYNTGGFLKSPSLKLLPLLLPGEAAVNLDKIVSE